MSIVTIDNNGIVSVGSGPNESYVLEAPTTGYWTVAVDGTASSISVTSGASGPGVRWVLTSPNGIGWLVSVTDGGVLQVTSFNALLVLAPIVNNPIIYNGLPASGYQLFIYQAGTMTSATVYGDIQALTVQTPPIVLNAYGMPTTPIFLVIGAQYDFVLYPPGGGTPILTWPYVSGGVPVNVQTPTEWVQPAVLAMFLSASSFTVTGDLSNLLWLGRRVQLTASSTLYGTITGLAYDGRSTTTISVALDSGTLDGTLTAMNYALVRDRANPLPDRRTSQLSTILSGPLVVPTVSGVNLIAAGTIAYHINPLPSGWLKCDGTSYLRASYPNLFAAIGTTFGAADGSHFNVPTISNLATSMLAAIYAQV